MTLNAPYAQMMHVLSARGLDWFRRRIEDLPDPLPVDHHALSVLSDAARFAPVCSGLRGSASPLETFVRRRLDQRLVTATCALVGKDRLEPGTADILAAAQGMGIGDSVLHRAIRAFQRRDDLDLATRLALATLPDPQMLAEAEAWLRAPRCAPQITDGSVDRFSRVLMQLYGFGARRPQFSTPRAYGEIFDNCLRIAAWALRGKHLTALAQIIYCICLVDPDHDVGAWLAEVIASQRPDGSFPARTGFGTADQDLATGGRSTIMAVAALHMALYRRWNRPPPDRIAA